MTPGTESATALTDCPQDGPERIEWIIKRAGDLYDIRNTPLCPPEVFEETEAKLNKLTREFWPELVLAIESATALMDAASDIVSDWISRVSPKLYDIVTADERKSLRDAVAKALSQERQQRQEAERAIAFKDQTNARLQSLIEGEAKLRAQLTEAQASVAAIKQALGFHVTEKREMGGEQYTISHDPALDLGGAIEDIERSGVCDKTSLQTLKRVEKKLHDAGAMFDNLPASAKRLIENQRTPGAIEICPKPRCGRSAEFVKRHNSCSWDKSQCPLESATLTEA